MKEIKSFCYSDAIDYKIWVILTDLACISDLTKIINLCKGLSNWSNTGDSVFAFGMNLRWNSPGMGDKVINRDVYCFSLLDVTQCFDDEVIVKCIYREGRSTEPLLGPKSWCTGGVTSGAAGGPTDVTWVVKVKLALECLGLLLRGEHSVEGVLAEDGNLSFVLINVVLTQQLHDLAAHWRLTRQEEPNTRYEKMLAIQFCL